MAERLDQTGADDAGARHLGDAPADDASIVGHTDGSSARVSTQDGHLEHDDVEKSPIVQGTDPLGDDAIERRRGGESVTPQLVIFALLALMFAYLFVSDLVNGDWLKALLGAVVLAVCGFAIVREVRPKD